MINHRQIYSHTWSCGRVAQNNYVRNLTRINRDYYKSLQKTLHAEFPLHFANKKDKEKTRKQKKIIIGKVAF